MELSKKSTKKSSPHIKRPQNSFMIWASEHRQIFCKTNPNISNGELSKILGKAWLNLSKEHKYTYIIKANKTKLEHALQYPDYKYQPRPQKQKTVIPKVHTIHKVHSLQNLYNIKICKIEKQNSSKPILLNSTRLEDSIFEEPDYFSELQLFYENISL